MNLSHMEIEKYKGLSGSEMHQDAIINYIEYRYLNASKLPATYLHI